MMTARKARSLRLAALAIAPGPLCIGTLASADTRMGADVSAGTTIESNPYLSSGGSGDIALSLQVDPWLRLSDSIYSLDLRADLSVRQYTKNYNGTEVTGTVNLAGTHRLSPNFNLSGGINYMTALNGINYGFANVGPNEPVPPPTTPLPDITLGGTRTRTQSAAANIGFSARPSPLDQIGASFTASHSSYNSSTGRDYNYFNGGLNYSRSLSEHTAITLSVRYGKSDYLGTRVGDGTIITPEAGVDMRLSERITLGASFGASFSRSLRADGTTGTAISPSGTVRLCRSLYRGGICLVASQSAQPSGVGSIDTVASVALSYDKRLSKRDNVTFSLAFDRSKTAVEVTTGPETFKYYSAGGTWSHILGRRLSMYVSPGYSRIMNSSSSSNSFILSAGLRLSLGAIS